MTDGGCTCPGDLAKVSSFPPLPHLPRGRGRARAPPLTETAAARASSRPKAFGGGADFVMLGGMFAGHDESAGELVQQGDKWFKSFYGMSSAVAMHKHSGGVAE